MSPWVGVSWPAIMRSMVVLPQPLGPSRQQYEPCGMVRSRFSTAIVGPNRLVTPRIATSPPPVAWAITLLLPCPRAPALNEGDGAERGDDHHEGDRRGHRADRVQRRRGDRGGHCPDLQRQRVLAACPQRRAR